MVVVDGDAVVNAPGAAGVDDEHSDGESERERERERPATVVTLAGLDLCASFCADGFCCPNTDEAPVVVDDDGVEQQRQLRASNWKPVSECLFATWCRAAR